MNSVKKLPLVLLIFFFLAAQGAQAANDWASNAALHIKKALNTVYDPWPARARATDVASFVPHTYRTESTLVVPTWHMPAEPKPLVSFDEQIDDLRQLGITSFYLPPLSRQMLYDFFGAKNNHGYWPKNYDIHDVDPHLGSWEDLRKLIQDAHHKDLSLVLDVNARHLGYAPADGMVELWGRRVNVSDSEYFIQTPEPTPSQALMAELQGNPDAYVNVKMWGLPTLNLANPWVRSKVIEDYAEAARIGFDGFRIDAAKHMSADFLRELLARLESEVSHRGHQAHFILEYISGNYGEIAYRLGQIGNIPGIAFLDFRMQSEVRQVLQHGQSFERIVHALRDLNAVHLNQGFLVQSITDYQDGFFPPIYTGTAKSAEEAIAVDVLSQFTSTNRPFYAAGFEQRAVPGAKFIEPKGLVDKSSPLYAPIQQINHYMNESFGRLQPFQSAHILEASSDHIVIRRPFKEGERSLMAIVDRSGRKQESRRVLGALGASAHMVFHYGNRASALQVFILEMDTVATP